GGKAESSDVVVIIPEGFNVWEIDQRLFDSGLLAKAGDFARIYKKDEGYLFPDTYRFDAGLKDSDDKSSNPGVIAQIMKNNFYAKVGVPDRDDVIIASMLEKEGRTENDMALISGIIAERMRRGMLLQIDATVAYGWCLKQFALNKFSKNCDPTQA